MLNRRQLLRQATAAGLALALRPGGLIAQDTGPVIRRRIPSTGEELPIVGLGSSATFSDVADDENEAAVRDVLTALVDNGGKVFDTAPVYGASEQVAGRVAQEAGLHDRLFWATKINVRRQGGTLAAARAQVEASFSRYGHSPIDLIQVHNIPDFETQLPLLEALKDEGRIRYIGVTTTNSGRYDELAAIMRSAPIDFIGIDYAIDSRESAETILPLAQNRGIGVLVYQPFGRTRLWRRVRGRDVPAWAAEFGATTWAQFFLKYVAAHPAVTCITPATSRPANMIDNLGAARGVLPDEATRRRMVEVVEALPQA
jgi:aryl-alcohol dehydrogenase-like predicted oxidoreductase